MLAFDTLKVVGKGLPTRDLIPMNVKKFPSSGPCKFAGTIKSVRISASPAVDMLRVAHTSARNMMVLSSSSPWVQYKRSVFFGTCFLACDFFVLVYVSTCPRRVLEWNVGGIGIVGIVEIVEIVEIVGIVGNGGFVGIVENFAFVIAIK
nr:hypothetical protein [Tanacetum cinerariifolium]